MISADKHESSRQLSGPRESRGKAASCAKGQSSGADFSCSLNSGGTPTPTGWKNVLSGLRVSSRNGDSEAGREEEEEVSPGCLLPFLLWRNACEH
ncbi:hypothetical protein P7K49_025022 [Saguinus oedipus]|uniref:Uncharacterized protein n=1 Tax=Saguinus oedipus TaxID=9490 RepID=A0ABQ9UFZ8_SAGOE|nr:hypothetical protein P7K49_025022 [Saguinus oedipus]